MQTESEIFNSVYNDLKKRYPALLSVRDDLFTAFKCLSNSFTKGGSLYICGNGGSAADGEHIIGELMQPYKKDRPIPKEFSDALFAAYPQDAEYFRKHLKGALPCYCLSSFTGFCTAYINDHSADMVYAQEIYGYGKPGDVLLGITSSGSSKNVVNALKVADTAGIDTIMLTSEKAINVPVARCIIIRVPGTECCPVQELHLPVYHALCEMLELNLFR